ncbi:MAG: acyl-CoA carboxylase subunit beta [Puniceicoccales bacterium]|jgi:propionyl-CoA carboxylase beta chain|nr:acyl-CoA carboxylase subunit beta [Puniceicoccales bacterium]
MSIDPKLLDELNKRRAIAAAAGGADKLAKRKAEKGLHGARERLQMLFEQGTFQEFGQHAQNAHIRPVFDSAAPVKAEKPLPYDGVVTGTGYVNGRQVAAFSQDFTVSGGSLGQTHAKKICDILDYAAKVGCPVIGINDSGGARIQEAVGALSGYASIFYRNVALSGVVPQVTLLAGPCAGGAAYSPALTDFIIMTAKNSNLFICGPEVIKAATGEQATVEQFATAAAHASVSGNIHLIANDDTHGLQLAAQLLSYLPQNNLANPPHDLKVPVDAGEVAGFNDVIPATNKEAYDIKKVIALLADKNAAGDPDFLEIQPDFAKNIVVGFTRISGVVAGIIANQPNFKGGVLDIDASDKGARFIRTCNVFNIPVVNLVDVPGFMPGLAQERGGIIRHGAKMLFAYSSATVPKITVILRKAYGGAYIAMCPVELGADAVFAWPTAEIAVMGAEGAVNVIAKKEIEAVGEDPEARKARRAELIAEYRAKFASPYQAASLNMVTDVITPAETRRVVSLALRNTLDKRELRPSKKHGNIPL